MSDKLDIGVTASDTVTGFRGLVTGHARYITGCDQYSLQPKQKADGTFVEARWFDENRLVVDEFTTRVVIGERALVNAGGGPADSPAPTK